MAKSFEKPAEQTFQIVEVTVTKQRLARAVNTVRSSGLLSTPPASRPIFQETLRKWEKAVKESSYICNQGSGFNRCLTRVQDATAEGHSRRPEQKKVFQCQTVTDELQYLMDFSQSIS